MSEAGLDQSQTIHCYATASYPCSYLPGREARSEVATPAELIDFRVYGQLLRLGFRRSGEFVYRPACDGCSACVPVRLRVAEFCPDRSQRRALRRHDNLESQILPLDFVDEHFALYRRYQIARHAGGGMDLDDPGQYENFILKSRVASFLAEFREAGVLRMVSLIDQIEDGLSSVYTFFDPDVAGASYGVYNVLWQAALARRLGLPYLYLGYWIGECRKMAYKTRYRPLEGLLAGTWQALADDGSPAVGEWVTR